MLRKYSNTIPFAALFVIMVAMYILMDTGVSIPFKTVLRWVFPALMLFIAGLSNGKKFVLLPNATYFFMLVYFAVTIIVCSPVVFYSWQRLISLMLIIGAFATYYSLLSKRRMLDQVVKYIGAVSVVYGIVNFLFLNQAMSGRSRGITGNPNSLGLEANISLAFVIYFFAKAKPKHKKYWIILMITNSISAILAGSRTGFVLLVLNFLYLFVGISQMRRKWLPVVIAALLLAVFFLLPNEVLMKVPGLDRLITQGTDRGELWKYAFSVFLQKPWLGHGYGAVNTTTSIKVSEGMGYHSSYLTIMVETGIFGLAFVFAFVIPIIVKAVKKWLADRSREMGTMLFLAIILLVSFYGESSMTSVGSTEGFLFWGTLIWLLFRLNYAGDES